MSSATDTSAGRKHAAPTNLVNYRDRQMPARIAHDANIEYVVKMLCVAFDTREHHITLCLRDERDHLVTQATLHNKVTEHALLVLCSSPTTEALMVVNSLKLTLQRLQQAGSEETLPEGTYPLKLALFNLSKYIKEEDFAVHFMLKGGMKALLKLLERRDDTFFGNTMAYALQGVRGVMDLETGWGDISDALIDRILCIMMDASHPNVLRPATIIVKKLVLSGPRVSEEQTGLMPLTPYGKKGKAKAKGKERVADPDDVRVYGFGRIYVRMESVGGPSGVDGGPGGAHAMLRVVLKRLEGTGDLELVAQSLSLVNALLRAAPQENVLAYQKLIGTLEALGIRRYVSRLMPNCVNNVCEPQILTFQARYAAILQSRRLRPVRPQIHRVQEQMLAEIWDAGSLDAEPGMSTPRSPRRGGSHEQAHNHRRHRAGWRRLGLTADDSDEDQPFLTEVELFRDVGELGLECLHWFAMHEDSLQNLILEQEARPADRRCPIGRASAECVKILCEHYKISQAPHRAPSQFQLFVLNFPRLHQLVVKFFLRMWHDSESRLDDFPKVALLVRSQIKFSLAEEASKSWLTLDHDFPETDYRTIRDRQMQSLEKEDGMLARPSIQELRDKLGKEAYDVLSEQRIGCMLQGSWFNSAIVLVRGVTPATKASMSTSLRFVRLAPNRKTLGWADFPHRLTTNPPYEALRERIDILNLTDVRLHTGCAIGSRSPNLVSKLSFSLMSGGELSLLDLDAIHGAQLAEWTDGIRVLRGEGGMSTQETAHYVHVLTELAVKVRLLDITGDGVELPQKVSYGAAPQSVDFWFAK